MKTHYVKAKHHELYLTSDYEGRFDRLKHAKAFTEKTANLLVCWTFADCSLGKIVAVRIEDVKNDANLE